MIISNNISGVLELKKKQKNKKKQEINRHVLDKNLDAFPQNSTFFIQILMITLKIDVTLKSFLAMQFSIIV